MNLRTRFWFGTFWLLLALAHLACLVLMVPALHSSWRVLLMGGFELAVIAACTGLLLQRRLLSQMLWARVFGVAAATTLLMLANTFPVLLGGSSANFALVSAQVVASLTGCFALFLYTFASPSVWPIPAPAEACPRS